MRAKISLFVKLFTKVEKRGSLDVDWRRKKGSFGCKIGEKEVYGWQAVDIHQHMSISHPVREVLPEYFSGLNTTTTTVCTIIYSSIHWLLEKILKKVFIEWNWILTHPINICNYSLIILHALHNFWHTKFEINYDKISHGITWTIQHYLLVIQRVNLTFK